jgi:hypothetical protein
MILSGKAKLHVHKAQLDVDISVLTAEKHIPDKSAWG